MKTRLFPLVFDVDLPGTLMVQQHLSENEFEVVLVHVHARVRYLIISHVREVEGRAVAMAGLGDGIDIAASLKLPYVFLRAEHGSDIEAVVRQAVSGEDVRPFVTYRIQLAFG